MDLYACKIGLLDLQAKRFVHNNTSEDAQVHRKTADLATPEGSVARCPLFFHSEGGNPTN